MLNRKFCFDEFEFGDFQSHQNRIFLRVLKAKLDEKGAFPNITSLNLEYLLRPEKGRTHRVKKQGGRTKNARGIITKFPHAPIPKRSGSILAKHYGEVLP